MAYAAMMVLNQQIQYQTIGQADTNPATFTTMINNAPLNDGIAHLFEFTLSDTTGLVTAASMDKVPISIT